MKKIVSIIFVVMITATLSAIPSDDLIQNAANELGIPFNNLKAYVNIFYPTERTANNIVEIDIKNYIQDYSDNSLLADRKYAGKTLQMTITFNGIKPLPATINGCRYSISAKEDGGFTSFDILSTYDDILATLQPGQRLIIEGKRYNPFTIGPCRIIQVLN